MDTLVLQNDAWSPCSSWLSLNLDPAFPFTPSTIRNRRLYTIKEDEEEFGVDYIRKRQEQEFARLNQNRIQPKPILDHLDSFDSILENQLENNSLKDEDHQPSLRHNRSFESSDSVPQRSLSLPNLNMHTRIVINNNNKSWSNLKTKLNKMKFKLKLHKSDHNSELPHLQLHISTSSGSSSNDSCSEEDDKELFDFEEWSPNNNSSPQNIHNPI